VAKEMAIMKRSTLLLIAVAALLLALAASPALDPCGKQYCETTWTYNSSYNYFTTYYYQNYHGKFTTTKDDYNYRIYYPSKPTHVNCDHPTRQQYWGRYEIGSRRDKRYPPLEEKDRKLAARQK
jgi:hypothetical protein